MQENRTAAQETVKDQKMLRLISPAYAGRGGALTLALQYVYQLIALGREDAQAGSALRPLLERKLTELMQLGSLIEDLGAQPVFTAMPPYPVSHFTAAGVEYSKSPSAMFEADLRLERAAIERYTRLLSTLPEGSVSACLLSLREGCIRNVKDLLALSERLLSRSSFRA